MGPELNFEVMEPLLGLELFDYIVEHAPVTEALCRSVVHQSLSALDYVHGTMHLIHRDVKPQNFKFRSARSAEVVLLDFGLCTSAIQDSTPRTRAGTLEYAAPEVFTGFYGTRADMWSLGVMMYMMLTGLVPFSFSREETNFSVTCEEVEDALDAWELKGAPLVTMEIMRSLLVVDPKERWSASQALEHEWFESMDAPASTTLDSLHASRSNTSWIMRVARIHSAMQAESNLAPVRLSCLSAPALLADPLPLPIPGRSSLGCFTCLAGLWRLAEDFIASDCALKRCDSVVSW